MQVASGSEIIPNKWRNIIGFWLLGMANNYVYVVILSAAHDILSDGKHPQNHSEWTNTTSAFPSSPSMVNWTTTNDTIPNHRRVIHCTPIGTGVILLADILPSLFCKLSAPFYLQRLPYWFKCSFASFLAIFGLIIVALSNNFVLSLFGVICASFSSGLGEATFLSLTTFFHSSSVSGFSSGTGGAGVTGALSYTVLTTFLPPKTALLVVCFVPSLLMLSYFFILKYPPMTSIVNDGRKSSVEEDEEELLLIPSDNIEYKLPDFRNKLQILYGLSPLMLALFFVYVFEYTINQAFFELAYFPDIFITPAEQYRWYQLDYQIGVFVSRSSVSLIHFRRIWIMTVLQGFNVVLILTQIIYFYMPSVWVMLLVVFYEGILGGLTYVNAFYRIRRECDPRYSEWSMATVSVSDSLGITVAGLISVPIHNILCRIFSSVVV